MIFIKTIKALRKSKTPHLFNNGFIETDVVCFSLITILSLHFFGNFFFENHREWSVICYYFSS